MVKEGKQGQKASNLLYTNTSLLQHQHLAASTPILRCYDTNICAPDVLLPPIPTWMGQPVMESHRCAFVKLLGFSWASRSYRKIGTALLPSTHTSLPSHFLHSHRLPSHTLPSLSLTPPHLHTFCHVTVFLDAPSVGIK